MDFSGSCREHSVLQATLSVSGKFVVPFKIQEGMDTHISRGALSVWTVMQCNAELPSPGNLQFGLQTFSAGLD